MEVSQMKQNVRVVGKWRGYYLEDIDCQICQYWVKKRGCPFAICQYEDEKLDALAHGRISRKRGSMRWDK